MREQILIRPLEQEDIPKIIGMLKEPYMLGREDYYRSYFNRCFNENISKIRTTYVAYAGTVPAGYVNIILKSDYPYFQDNKIPEINDLYVTPKFRKIGVGKQLLDACEAYAKKHGLAKIGLGVGLYQSYGSAQRLYAKNGYIPDGNGLMYHNKPVDPGISVFVDDELLLYLYKDLGVVKLERGVSL